MAEINSSREKNRAIAATLGGIFGITLVWGSFLAFKAFLLVLVLGWFGVTVLGFWQAVIVLILLDLIVNTFKSSK